jgi:hypothetical protein
MCDGLVIAIRPSSADCRLLENLKAFWSIDDTIGGVSVTAVHPRARNLVTPLTGAGFQVKCFPSTLKTGEDAVPVDLSYEVSFYPPASLTGNNIFPENAIRIPAEAALACWKDYMRRMWPTAIDALDRITVADCSLRIVTMVYLWHCETGDAAKQLHNRMYRHVKAVLDGSTKSRPRDKLGKVIPNPSPKVRTDGQHGDTFYVDTPWGQIRCYIKTRHSAKNFCAVENQEVLELLYEQSSKVVRLEIELVVDKFRFGARPDERFPLNPEHWHQASLLQDPYEIVWESIRRYCRFDDTLAKHEPKGLKLKDLTADYQSVLAAHLAGEVLLQHPVIDGDHKKLSRIAKRLMKSDIKVNLWLPWKLQQGETWSGWLGGLLQYKKRFRPSQAAELAPYCLGHHNVIGLRDKLLEKIRDVGPASQPIVRGAVVELSGNSDELSLAELAELDQLAVALFVLEHRAAGASASRGAAR